MAWYRKALFDPNVDAKLKQEFMDELSTMQRCSGHENTVDVIGAHPKAPKMCMLMQLCSQRTDNLVADSQSNSEQLGQSVELLETLERLVVGTRVRGTAADCEGPRELGFLGDRRRVLPRADRAAHAGFCQWDAER